MYNFETEKPHLFTNEGIQTIIEVRDVANKLARHGSFILRDAIKGLGRSWLRLAAFDWLVHQGYFQRSGTNHFLEGRDNERYVRIK